MMDFDLIQILSSSSDAAVVILIYFIYKLDKRVSRIEYRLFNNKK